MGTGAPTTAPLPSLASILTRMRLTETGLRQLVRQLLREAGTPLPPPDQPDMLPEDELGQWIMPGLRTGAAYAGVQEPDTGLELSLARALKSHYDSNADGELEAIWDRLVDLRGRGLYQDLLEPPGGPAYRFMMVAPDRALKFLGVTQEVLEAEPGKAHRAPSPPPFRPRGLVASWTLDPDRMVRDGAAGLFVWREPGLVALCLRASSQGAAFLLNPERVGRDWDLARYLASEVEVLSGGPVGLDGAAWVYFPGDRARGAFSVEAKRGDQVKLARALVAALG